MAKTHTFAVTGPTSEFTPDRYVRFQEVWDVVEVIDVGANQPSTAQILYVRFPPARDVEERA